MATVNRQEEISGLLYIINLIWRNLDTVGYPEDLSEFIIPRLVEIYDFLSSQKLKD